MNGTEKENEKQSSTKGEELLTPNEMKSRFFAQESMLVFQARRSRSG